MKDISGDEWRAQLKVDGIRAMVHIDNGDVTVFSRAENDITGSVPEIHNEFDWPETGKYIFDGEIISENNSYSETTSRVGRDAENVDRDVEMEYSVFDCVVYQGDDISDWTYENRFDAVNEIVNSINDDRLWLPKLWYDYEDALEMVSESNAEGLILKQMNAPYEFGKRSEYWIKDKHDAETIDVVISGFHEGDGESTGTLGAIEIESADGVPLGRSGSGFTESQRNEIWNNQDEWLGRCVEIEGRGIGSEDKIRMPIFKRDRSDDGEPDSWDRIQEIMKEV